ncbi:WD repeat-containing protein 25 [Hordeum vulgare]|nr:WD repeat-containing protein 25 [Hordeum vulgare]
MDLLSAAYGANSDDDDPAPSWPATALPSVAPPPAKRPRWESPPYPGYPPPPPLPAPRPAPLQAPPPPLSGRRYVSKRERALLAASQPPVGSAAPLPPPVAPEFDSPGEDTLDPLLTGTLQR